MDKSPIDISLTRSIQEPAIYFNIKNSLKLCGGVCVDDLLVSGSTSTGIKEFNEKMKNKFDMIDLGMLGSYLGIQVKQIMGEITLSQKTFAQKILPEFNMQECNSCQTPIEVRPSFNQKEGNSRMNFIGLQKPPGFIKVLNSYSSRSNVLCQISQQI